jgi:hypothetical protein
MIIQGQGPTNDNRGLLQTQLPSIPSLKGLGSSNIANAKVGNSLPCVAWASMLHALSRKSQTNWPSLYQPLWWDYVESRWEGPSDSQLIVHGASPQSSSIRDMWSISIQILQYHTISYKDRLSQIKHHYELEIENFLLHKELD